MKKLNLFLQIIALLAIVACGKKTDKTKAIESQKTLAEQSVKDLNTVRTAKEIPPDTLALEVPFSKGPDQLIIDSRMLGERRPVLVFTPQSYHNTQFRYPVLIVLDGDGPGALKAMSVVNLLQDLTTGSIPELIVVTIPNFDRSKDLVPPHLNMGGTDSEGQSAVPNSHADLFLAFIEKELLPVIDLKYRTHPIRFLHGSSYGGLFGIYSFVTHPTLFKGIVAASPSLWVDQKVWVDSLKSSLQNHNLMHQWLYITAGEFDHDLITSQLPLVYSALRSKAPPSLKWHVEIIEGHDHQSANYASLEFGLQFIFRDFQIPYQTLAEMELKEVCEHYENLSSSYGWTVRMPVWALNRLALIKDATGRPWQEAVAAARAIAEDYPWLPYGYDAQTWFLPKQELQRAIELEKDAIRVAKKSGYWSGEYEGALANYESQIKR